MQLNKTTFVLRIFLNEILLSNTKESTEIVVLYDLHFKIKCVFPLGKLNRQDLCLDGTEESSANYTPVYKL